MQKKLLVFISTLLFTNLTFAQTDSVPERFSFHFQGTVVTQIKPKFTANYSGPNSLSKEKETQTSITSTLYLGARLWKNGSVFFNPELAGGSGLSGALGVGASTNGETFRVGDPKPQNYVARLYYQHIIPLSSSTETVSSDLNVLGGKMPTDFLRITIGKVSLSDFFDQNTYSHDPRTRFLSWGLMNNGAWDYAANTRGYTHAAVFELVKGNHEFRYAYAKLPTEANGSVMNNDITKVFAQNIEYTRKYKNGAIRFLAFYNTANMGSYRQSLDLAAARDTSPDIGSTQKVGNKKFGFGVNVEQEINDYLGFFMRAGWNNGKTETWVFTEIDQTVQLGLVANGKKWSRNDDAFGIAAVVSGISKDHREYLQKGGRGFMLGDGTLTYSSEQLLETYYELSLVNNNIKVAGFYQFIQNPGYNSDRGPVSVFSVRLHVVI